MLNALYHDSTLDRKQRLAALKGLDVAPYFKYLNITAKKERFLMLLLKGKAYMLYDLARVLAVKMKK